MDNVRSRQRNKLKTTDFDQCCRLIFRLLLASTFTSTLKIFSYLEILSIHFSKEKKISLFLLYWCFHTYVHTLTKQL